MVAAIVVPVKKRFRAPSQVRERLCMWQRWGGTIEDSQNYFNTARYLRGELPFSALVAPFPYRLTMPALAAALPGDLRNNFATLNWLAVVGTAVTLSWLVHAVGGDRRRAVLAGLLLILSVPTYWYAPYLLTDPGAIFGRSVFVLGVVTGQPWVALAGGLFATTVREENILLLGWLLAFGRVGLVRGGIVLALAALWLVAVRWFRSLSSPVSRSGRRTPMVQRQTRDLLARTGWLPLVRHCPCSALPPRFC
jgi:hypothetical protein